MYTLVFKPRAESDLEDLDTMIRSRVLTKLQDLCDNCEEHRHKALKGRHRGKFRLKIGHTARSTLSMYVSARLLFMKLDIVVRYIR